MGQTPRRIHRGTVRETGRSNMEQRETFSYHYSAPEQREIQSIRKKYLPAPEDKLEELKRLDRLAQNAGLLPVLTLGTAGGPDLRPRTQPPCPFRRKVRRREPQERKPRKGAVAKQGDPVMVGPEGRSIFLPRGQRPGKDPSPALRMAKNGTVANFATAPFPCGATGQNRTDNLLITSEMLCH